MRCQFLSAGVCEEHNVDVHIFAQNHTANSFFWDGDFLGQIVNKRMRRDAVISMRVNIGRARIRCFFSTACIHLVGALNQFFRSLLRTRVDGAVGMSCKQSEDEPAEKSSSKREKYVARNAHPSQSLHGVGLQEIC